MTDKSFLEVDNVTHRYAERVALDALSFFVRPGEIFGLLGPNGSGKTTLFRILSTLLPLQSGTVRVGQADLSTNLAAVRQQLGVVFQSPSLDKKLSVRENMLHQGHLYGLSGAALKERIAFLLEQFRLTDRCDERVENLSGGLARRVEVAKGLLHRPQLLLLDEPTTGLDPNARLELWDFLQKINETEHATIVVTTHLMDEAERCNRIMILNHGKRVCLDTPAALRAGIGGQVLIIESADPAALRSKLALEGKIVGNALRLELASPAELTAATQRAQALLNAEVSSYTVTLPTLEDVFIHHTGQKFEVAQQPLTTKKKK
jgi:ABC-2 type transport system ATP-binding protein